MRDTATGTLCSDTDSDQGPLGGPGSQTCEGVGRRPRCRALWTGLWRSSACERRVAGRGDGHHVWMDRGEDDPFLGPPWKHQDGEMWTWGGGRVASEQRASPASHFLPQGLRANCGTPSSWPWCLRHPCPSSSEPGTVPNVSQHLPPGSHIDRKLPSQPLSRRVSSVCS